MKKIRVPDFITLRGELDDGSANFELGIPINEVRLASAKEGLPLIHTLAAWRLIQEHEERRAPLPQPVSAATDDEIRKAVVVHLGEKYQLASQYTSFVAIDYGQGGRQHRNRANPFHHPETNGADDADVSNLPAEADSQRGLGATILNFFSRFLPHETRESHSPSPSPIIPGGWADFPSSPPPASDDGADDDGYESVETFSTLSSLADSTEWSDWSPPPSPEPRMSEEDAQRQRSPSPNFESEKLAPEAQRHTSNALPVRIRPPPAPVRPEVVKLVKCQLYDGSFPLQSLRDIVGANAVEEAKKRQLDEAVWATALSVAFIERHMGSQKELMEDLLMKAREYLGTRTDIDEKVLIRLAKELIQ